MAHTRNLGVPSQLGPDHPGIAGGRALAACGDAAIGEA
jgi:hypothetical protein